MPATTSGDDGGAAPTTTTTATTTIRCRLCRRELAVAAYTPSRVRTHDHVCKRCAWQRYGRPHSDKRRRDPYERIARNLRRREQRDGGGSSATTTIVCTRALPGGGGNRTLTLRDVERLVDERFARRSALSGERVPLRECALVRRDAARPFDAHDNAALVSTAELRCLRRALHCVAAAAPPIVFGERNDDAAADDVATATS